MDARKNLLAVVVATAAWLGVAAPAMATITSANVTAPSDATQLFLNKLTNPNQTFTVTGTSNGTTGDSVDIQCYEVNSHLGGYTTGIPVDAGGNFSASIPVSAFPTNTCHLLAVPHGTTPSPGAAYTGPRVAFGQFDVATIPSGPNAGKAYDVTLGDMTMTAQTYMFSIDSCGAATTLPKDNDQTVTVSGYVFNCAGNFYNSNSEFGHSTDLTRSEIQVDGQNAYGAASAHNLFTGSQDLSGFPGATETLNSSDPSTGNLQETDTEPLVRCTPSNGYNPTSAGCTAFGSTGVSLSRVNQATNGARVITQTDTISSTDGAAHTIDLQYESDMNGSTVGWELPGESSFSQHSTGDTAGAAASGPGTVYVIQQQASSPSFTNPTGEMTFATPYTGIRFDDGLFSSQDSALIDYQRTVPAGGCTTISWSYGTGESASEVQGYASTATANFAAPSLSITSPSTGTRTAASSVTVSGTASASSGIDCVSVNGVGATVSGGTWSATVPLSAGQNTLTVTASSNTGGTQTASQTVTRDTSAPTISIATPANGATYTQGQSVSASYSCADPDGASDVASCAGPVASGAAIDTSTVGSHSFKVSAADQAGNPVSQTVTYSVSAKPAPPPPASPTVNTSGAPSDKSQGGGVLVTPGISVSCPAGGAACTANETATTTAPASAAHAKKRMKKFVIGTATFTIRAGSIKKLTFKLNATGRRLLRKLGHLRVTVKVVSRVDHNAPVTTTKMITIKQPHKKKKRHH